MPITDREQLTVTIRDLAVRAGEVILEYYDGKIGVTRKEDDSPVTMADVVAERVILDGLVELTPDVPAVAEEAVAAGQIPDVSGGPFWLVDPLDGTREFIGHNGEFTVQHRPDRGGLADPRRRSYPGQGLELLGEAGRAARIAATPAAPAP